MTAQNHIIKKQILDITLDSDTGSFAFQSRVSEIFKTEIVPLIDTYCTGIGGGSAIFRVNKLELDLGMLDKKNLVTDFKKKINELFLQKLAEALGVPAGVHRLGESTREQTLVSADFFYDRARAGREPVITGRSRDFELLTFFIKEGRLPWWVKSGELPEIEELLAAMVTKEPAKMKEFLTGVADQPALMQRIVYNADKSALEKLIALFHPRQAKEVCNLSGKLGLAFRDCPLFAAFSPAKVQAEIRAAILYHSFTAEGRYFNRQSIVENTVKHLAKVFANDEHAIYNYLAKEGKGGYERLKKVSRHKAKAAEKRLMDTQTETKTGKPRTAELDHRTSVYLQQLETIEKLVKELILLLPEKKKLLGSSATEELIIVLRQISTIIPGIKSIILNLLKKTAKSSIYSVTAPEMEEEQKKKAEEFEKLSQRLYHALTAVLDEKAPEVKDEVFVKADKIMGSINELSKAAQVSTERAEADAAEAQAFTEAEEIYLRNAGLVLLWPYLPAFFAATGLVNEKRRVPAFLSEDARERAVLLLHYLAFGSKEGREYDMTLNKILCGFAPGRPVNPCPDQITKEQIREAENFLQAVVGNWPVLKNTSVPAFRSLFLRREGVLFTRDGCRVLRVAEETHDVLLDRLPWGIGTVRLPWMEQLLLVEWRR